MKAEFVEADERIGRVRARGHVNAFHLRGRPDAQAMAFGLESVDERHFEAVKLDARVKAILQRLNDAGAEEGFSSAKENGNEHGQGRQKK
jgi:hypothetical protein